MSEGPIKQWRDGHKVEPVSTANHDRVCFAPNGRAYCGRRNGKLAFALADVNCADCGAALEADAVGKAAV